MTGLTGQSLPIDKTDGLHYQVDFGKEQTAPIHEWQIVKE
jgi:hypothetical protein